MSVASNLSQCECKDYGKQEICDGVVQVGVHEVMTPYFHQVDKCWPCAQKAHAKVLKLGAWMEYNWKFASNKKMRSRKYVRCVVMDTNIVTTLLSNHTHYNAYCTMCHVCLLVKRNMAIMCLLCS